MKLMSRWKSLKGDPFEKEKQLWEACTNGDLATVKSILTDHRRTVKLNWQDEELQRTAFYRACGHNQVDIVKYLLQHHHKELDKELCQQEGATPFCVSCSVGHLGVVELLMGSGVNVNTPMRTTMGSPFFYACQGGHVGVIKRLLEDPGVDINATSSMGVAPFYVLCEHGTKMAIDLLLQDHRLDLSQQAKFKGATPVYAACERGNTEVLELLLGDGRIEATMRREDGMTPLWIAAQNGRLEVTKLLLASVPEIDARAPRDDGRGPVEVALWASTQDKWSWESDKDHDDRLQYCGQVAALLEEFQLNPGQVRQRLIRELNLRGWLSFSFFFFFS